MQGLKKEFDSSVGCNIVNSPASSGSFSIEISKNKSKIGDLFKNIVIQAYFPNPEEKFYKVELFVKDNSQNTRRLIFSTINKGEAQVTSLHVKLPVKQLFPADIWTNVSINMSEISESYFSGFEFRQLMKINIQGVFKIRKVFLMKEEINESSIGMSNFSQELSTSDESKSFIPKWIDFPLKCKQYCNTMINHQRLKEKMKLLQLIELNNGRGQRNKSTINSKQHTTKNSPRRNNEASTIQKDTYQINKIDASSVSLGSDQKSSQQMPLKGKRIYKAKEIMNYIHNQNVASPINHSKNHSYQSIEKEDTNSQLNQSQLQNKDRFKSHRTQNNSISNQPSQYRINKEKIDEERYHPYRQSQKSVYKSQELQLPKIDQRDTNSLDIKISENVYKLPPPHHQLINKPRDGQVRNSSNNLKINANFKSNVNNMNIYKSNQALPTLKNIGGNDSKLKVFESDNEQIILTKDIINQYNTETHANDHQKQKYKSKNFHKIMKNVHQNQISRDQSQEGSQVKGWDGSDNQKSQSQVKQFSSIINQKQDGNTIKSTIVTTTKASIQIETTSKVINANPRDLKIIQVNRVDEESHQMSKKSSIKLPDIYQYQKAQHQFNNQYNYISQNSNQVPFNEQWKHTDSSIQEEIIGENQITLNSNQQKYSHKFEYGSPKLKYRESMKNNGGIVGGTTDNFDRLSVDLDGDDEDDHYNHFFNNNDKNDDTDRDYDIQLTGFGQFDNLLGKKQMERESFTPPFMRSKVQDQQQQQQLL